MPDHRLSRGLEVVITGLRIMLGAASDDAVSSVMNKFAQMGKAQDERINGLHERLLKLEEARLVPDGPPDSEPSEASRS